MNTVPVTIRLSPDLKEGMERAAREDNRTVSWLIRHAVNEALERWEKEGVPHEQPHAELLQQLCALSREELANVLQALGIWVMPPQQ